MGAIKQIEKETRIYGWGGVLVWAGLAMIWGGVLTVISDKQAFVGSWLFQWMVGGSIVAGIGGFMSILFYQYLDQLKKRVYDIEDTLFEEALAHNKAAKKCLDEIEKSQKKIREYELKKKWELEQKKS